MKGSLPTSIKRDNQSNGDVIGTWLQSGGSTYHNTIVPVNEFGMPHEPAGVGASLKNIRLSDGLDGSTFDMAVDGTTPVYYYYHPAAGYRMYVTRIVVELQDAGVHATSNFLAFGAPLTNGIEIKVVTKTDSDPANDVDIFDWTSSGSAPTSDATCSRASSIALRARRPKL